MALFTVEQWLRGHVDYEVPETTYRTILFDNGIDVGALAEDLTERQRDLCLADLYMWLAKSSTSSTGEYMSDGGWQHQKSAKNVVNRNALIEDARRLYKKWDSPKADEIGGKVIIRNLY